MPSYRLGRVGRGQPAAPYWVPHVVQLERGILQVRCGEAADVQVAGCVARLPGFAQQELGQACGLQHEGGDDVFPELLVQN